MLKNILYLFILLLCLSACGQKIGRRYESKKFDKEIYLNSPSRISANNERNINSKDSAGNILTTPLSHGNVLFPTETIDNEKDRIPFGELKQFYPDGKLKTIIYYDNTRKSMQLTTYYPNGILKRECDFLNGSLISSVCFDSLGNKTPHCDINFEPEIDLNKFNSCLVYPEILKKEDCQEIVIVRMLINKNKKVVAIKYDSDNSKEFITEIIKCVEKFNSGTDSFILTPYLNDGKPMPIWISIPINFTLK